ncbi:HD-GYP domain-containing protein [Ureibacillus acetophenoni]|uniref:HD domain-containing protein n=1 Tax=Ureibacillus acetophenoni TaxID=614649 RepID=A0A285UJ50_9BACL|nr:HD domain-containing phosphohydrolase [Ureibacillus acetophenoni]SOC41428.1 HD domain-containing protein [Ureibacillus acetophenoni]
MLDNFGLRFLAAGQALEVVSTDGMDVALLSSYDGTEIIHHRLRAESSWAIGPSEGWTGSEFIFLLAGEMSVKVKDNIRILKAGDSLNASLLTHDCFFQANEETEFLYVTSQPVFYHYSNVLQGMRELAIQVEEKDGYTADHCKRILQLSMTIGERMKLNSTELYQLNLGSFLHDIGKVKVPENVLNKPGKLTSEEWEVMKMHPTYGKEVLEEANFPFLEVAAIVEQHHERFNGTGYPKGLQGEEISVAAAIVSVVDSFDAMTTDRVYRKALTHEEATAEILKGRGTLYHPEVVDHFIAILSDVKGGEIR